MAVKKRIPHPQNRPVPAGKIAVGKKTSKKAAKATATEPAPEPAPAPPPPAPAPAPAPAKAPAPAEVTSAETGEINMRIARRLAGEILMARMLPVLELGSIAEIPSVHIRGRQDIFVVFGLPSEDAWGCGLVVRNKGTYDRAKSMDLARQLALLLAQIELPNEGDFAIFDAVKEPDRAVWLDIIPGEEELVPEDYRAVVQEILKNIPKTTKKTTKKMAKKASQA